MRRPTKVFWFDLETTGTEHWRHGITQIAGIIEIDEEVMSEFNIKVNPDDSVDIDSEALAVSGTTMDDLEEFEDESVAYDKLTNILDRYIDKFDPDDKFWVGGYNCQFDIDFLGSFWRRNSGRKEWLGSYLRRSHSIDPYPMINVLVHQGKIDDLKNHQLETVANYFNIEPDGEFHDAMTDVRITKDLYYELVDPNASYRS